MRAERTASLLNVSETGPYFHSGMVTTVAWSRDGQTVASADFNGVVKLWDVTVNRAAP